MLVLNRRQSQKIVIGKAGDVLTEPIEVMCVDVRSNGTTRIGITAQLDVAIMREELIEPMGSGTDASYHN